MAEQVIEVALREGYKIYVGKDTLPYLGGRLKRLTPGKIIVVTHSALGKLYAKSLKESLEKAGLKYHILQVPQGEEYKSLKTASKVYDKLLQLEVQRWDPIVAFGGGVIGDLAGFVASTYMRGVPFVQVPTTLVGQVDSSVGGKVAVNLAQGKNLIGCFYQPKFVLIDVSTLKTLPQRELKAGLAEVIKYGFLKGEEFLSFLEANLSSILELKEELLVQVVLGCCKIKAKIVEEDEKDLTGRRAILNYGHTIGHALEALSGYKEYLHGEAIAMGMLGAAFIAQEMGLINQDLVQRHIRMFKKSGLPTKLPGLKVDEVLNQIERDKKARSKSKNFILLKKVGNPVVVDVSEEVIKKVLTKLL